MSLTIRPAGDADLGTVVDLWTEAAAWLGEQGESQWQYPVKLPNIRAAIAARTCWLVEEPDHSPVATVTVDNAADPRLWRPEDLPAAALYVHRLVVRRSCAARDLGSAIIDWAGRKAVSAGKSWLRLDAWTSNVRLHRYYLGRGFRLVRLVREPGVRSGVLFERAASRALGRGPALCEVGASATACMGETR